MMTGVLAFVGAVLCAVIFVLMKKQSQAANQYKKRNANRAPSLGKNPLDDQMTQEHMSALDDDEDPDVILGIKPADQEITKEKTLETELSTEAQSESDNLDDESPVEDKIEEQVPVVNAQPIVLYALAPQGSRFGGYELLQSMLATGLRFGNQQIFHRHEHKDGRGHELFHCASAEKPGTFDVSNMGDFSTVGLCFFFTLDNKILDPLATFDLMLDTVDQLIEDLGGAVFDIDRKPFTKESLVQLRQQLRAFAEKNSTADLFA